MEKKGNMEGIEELDDIDKDELHEHYRFVASDGQVPLRVDKFLMNFIENATRNKIQEAAKNGSILVNNISVKSSYKVKPKDVVSVVLSHPPHENLLVAEDIPLSIVYEDDVLLVVNKPAGMVVHPGHGNYSGTLVNGLIHHIENLPSNSNHRPGLVHRIDKDTSGLLVVAKTEGAMKYLSKQFFDKSTERCYYALVWGNVEADEGTIEGYIGRSLKNRLQMSVFPDADLEKVIPGAARACFFLQGQNCMAGTRLFVHKDIYDPVLAGVKEMAEAFTIGHGLIPTNDFGPLISATQKKRVMEYIQIGKDEGADLLSGGESVGDKGYFVQPTIFSNVKGDMRIAREEIFGPVLCAESFDDSDLETIANKANNTSYGLSGSVWTQDISVAHKMAMLIDSGQVSINCHAAVDPAIPFGGNKQSGWGREFGEEGLEPYLKTKATTVIF